MKVMRGNGLRYGVGLGISAALHVVLVGGYAYVMSTHAPVLNEAAEVSYSPTKVMEVIRLPPDGDPAPDGDVGRTLAFDATEPVETPTSPSRRASEWISVDVDMSYVASASVAAPLQGELTALPPGAVNAQASQVMSSIGQTGWRPGMYEEGSLEGTVEHDDHRHALFGGFILPTSSCTGGPGSGAVTSVNNVSPLGGIRR